MNDRPPLPQQSLRTRAWVDKLLPLIGLALFFVLWWGVAASGWISSILLPTPIATLSQLFGSIADGTLLTDFNVTVVLVFQTFMIAAAIGVPLGIVLGSSDQLYRSVEFLIDLSRSIPPPALVPLFLLLFGLGEFSKLAISVFSVVLIVIFNTAYGVMNSNKARILAAKVMGANRLRIFGDVLFWECLPQTFIGLRSGISFSLVIVIVAEMLMGAEQGLGKRIITDQQVLNIKDMYASILVAGLLGYTLNLIFYAIEKRFVHWSGK
jgi:ABC-type nitrate/sulfonate/bicarbonate transport system permease component